MITFPGIIQHLLSQCFVNHLLSCVIASFICDIESIYFCKFIVGLKTIIKCECLIFSRVFLIDQYSSRSFLISMNKHGVSIINYHCVMNGSSHASYHTAGMASSWLCKADPVKSRLLIGTDRTITTCQYNICTADNIESHFTYHYDAAFGVSFDFSFVEGSDPDSNFYTHLFFK